MDIKKKLLASAARVFAEAGYRGATTRRIAQEAGVNEITLFRHFGCKDTLLAEAVRLHGAPALDMVALPERSSDPFAELLEWGKAQHAFLLERRSLIRTCMGELEERPSVGHPAQEYPQGTATELAAYLGRLRNDGLTTLPFDPGASAWMLLGAVFGDAMWRGILPELYGDTAEEAIIEYVRLTLSSIGITAPAPELSETSTARARKA